jgi:asparagine synthase (glutamine-hydrolysing)
VSAICGIVNFDGKPVEKSDLETMVASSPYRGPDGTHYHLDGNAGFAYLAFQVTPESVHERQPLISDDGRLVLVADVRLDNREELAGKLGIALGVPVGAGPASGSRPCRRLSGDNNEEHRRQGRLSQGHHPQKNSGTGKSQLADSELLLHAWLRWGKTCVDHLLGDFVFAVWDRQKQELFLARDPLGGYSVTWHKVGTTLFFASETTAILDLPTVEPRIKQVNVAKVLAHMPRGAEETFFESIFYLPAAHWMRASPEGLDIRKYWDIDPEKQIEYASEGEYAEHFLALTDQAVQSRMRSARPVGVALSGGHDSSLLAACAARNLSVAGLVQHRIKSFSYVFDHCKEADERQYIEAVTDHCDLDAEYLVSDDLWTFRELETQPVPRDYLWTNCYSQLPSSIARAAGETGCGVLIDGQFGDALCSGQSLVTAEMLQQARFVELFSMLRSQAGGTNWRQELIERGIRPLLPSWLRRSWRKIVPARLAPFVSGLQEHWVRRLQEDSAGAQEFGVMKHLGPARKQRYGYLMNASWSHGFAAARGQVYNRRGIERVSPFFDRRIVEFIMAAPPEQLTCPGKYRRLQTNAMKLVLPSQVYQRREKASFDPLLREGLLVREKAVVHDLLADPELTRQGWVSANWLEGQNNAGDNWEMAGYPFSMCLHLELWLKAVEEMSAGNIKWATPYKYQPS